MAEWRHRPWPPAWWPQAVGVAAALKWHFSVAAASELEWMLRPLSLLLQLLAGWHFRPDGDGEWQSHDAGIVLVKACAGINFMVLSYLGWCWMLRPEAGATTGRANRRCTRLWPLIEWPVLLLAALVLAWLTSLAVNAMRILAVVHLQPVLQRWAQPAQAHRLIGLLVYMPALSLQLALTNRRHWRRAVLAGCGLYASLMLLLPLVTGNARLDSAAYWQHAGIVLPVLVAAVTLALQKYVRSDDGD